MSNLSILAAFAKTTSLEIAKQAFVLGTGLQNAAPGDKTGLPNNTIQYLLLTSDNLTHLAEGCEKSELLQLVRDAVQHDKDLREKYNVGEKFRFVSDRLNALLSHIEESLVVQQKENEQDKDAISDDETLVYVHLYNAQGLVLQTWQKMVSASVFYEHSVNRPIYTEKTHVESFIRGKTNKVQHGYLTIIVKKQDIAKTMDAEPLKDTIGNPLVKVKEGSLRLERLVSFTHNGHDYVISEAKELVKKK